MIHHLGDGRWLDPESGVWRHVQGRVVDWVDYQDYQGLLQQTEVILAMAHLDHQRMAFFDRNDHVRNLKALCQRCHLRDDRNEYRKQTRITIRRRRAVGDLFKGPYR